MFTFIARERPPSQSSRMKNRLSWGKVRCGLRCDNYRASTRCPTLSFLGNDFLVPVWRRCSLSERKCRKTRKVAKKFPMQLKLLATFYFVRFSFFVFVFRFPLPLTHSLLVSTARCFALLWETRCGNHSRRSLSWRGRWS